MNETERVKAEILRYTCKFKIKLKKQFKPISKAFFKFTFEKFLLCVKSLSSSTCLCLWSIVNFAKIGNLFSSR